MDLKEIANLITIRNYVFNIINLPTIDKTTVTKMNNSLLLLDKKIIELLSSNEFKDYINYNDINEVIRQVSNITNIKSGLKK